MINQHDLKQKLHRLKEKGHITPEEYMELKKGIERRSVLYLKPKTIKCPNCGIEQLADKFFCPDCGSPMEEGLNNADK